MKKQQSGIGLIEILIAVGLLGGLVLMVSTLNQNSNKVTTGLEVNSDMLQTIQEIQQVLAKIENCNATFLGRNASHSPNVIQVLRKSIPSGFADVYPTITHSPQVSYGSKNLKIVSYSLSDAAPDVEVASHGTTYLVVNFNRGKNSEQTQVISKRAILNVKVDGAGNITSCAASSGSKNDIWKYSANNSDIYFSRGAVGIGTNSPTNNLTIQARTFPGASGISLIGNESVTAGWNRASISFLDETSNFRWSIGMHGTASNEGEGTFGIGGGLNSTTGMNRMLITKRGDVGINTNIVEPSCGLPPCNLGRFLHVHTNSGGVVDASQLVLTSEATVDNSIVGGVAFAASASGAADRRVGVITGHTGPGLTGSLLFWTNNNGSNNWNATLNPNGDFWLRGNADVQSINSLSDRRLKQNIQPLKQSLKKILLLEGIRFQWRDSNYPGTNLGLIAQDVKKVFPEVVVSNKDGFLGIVYTGLVAPTVEAIKSLARIETEQSKMIMKLEAENKMLEKYICRTDLKEKICQTY